MIRPVEELVRIASHGGGMTLEANRFQTEDLVRIASHAAPTKAILVLRGADHFSTDDLVKIASYGQGCVRFE